MGVVYAARDERDGSLAAVKVARVQPASRRALELEIEAIDIFAAGARVVVRYNVTGDHDGPLMGQQRTGHAIAFEGLTILYFADGKVVHRVNRADDIALLADHFLVKYGEQMGKSISGISQEALHLLQAYEWPGNIRQLENVIERAVALEKSQAILPESLPEHIAKRVQKGPAAAGLLPDSGFNLEEHVEGLEKEYITQALARAGGVQVKAAELLGIPYRSFRYYAKKYNLT